MPTSCRAVALLVVATLLVTADPATPRSIPTRSIRPAPPTARAPVGGHVTFALDASADILYADPAGLEDEVTAALVSVCSADPRLGLWSWAPSQADDGTPSLALRVLFANDALRLELALDSVYAGGDRPSWRERLSPAGSDLGTSIGGTPPRADVPARAAEALQRLLAENRPALFDAICPAFPFGALGHGHAPTREGALWATALPIDGTNFCDHRDRELCLLQNATYEVRCHVPGGARDRRLLGRATGTPADYPPGSDAPTMTGIALELDQIRRATAFEPLSDATDDEVMTLRQDLFFLSALVEDAHVCAGVLCEDGHVAVVEIVP